MKRNRSYVIALSIFVFASGSAPLVAQTLPTGTQGDSQSPAKIGLEAPYGYQSAGAPDRVVEVVAGKTKSLRVQRLETVRFIAGERSITWTFDTLHLPSIPLSKILPGAEDIIIYVDENPMYAH